MKELLSNTRAAILLWKLALVRAVLFSITTLCLAIQTSCISVDYSNLSPWEKRLLWIGIVGLWTNQMLTFLDKTASKINEGKPPIGPDMGNTDWLKKQKENG